MKRLPSVKSLQQAFGRSEGLKVRKLLDGRIEPRAFASVCDWLQQCYNPPSHDELVMKAIDELIEGFGVEAIRDEAHYVDHYHSHTVASYVNMGDTYNLTIIHDHTRDVFYLATYGDWYELYERRH